MSEVVVVALMTVKEGRTDEAIRGLTPVIEATHEEPGCITYALHRDRDNPDSLVLIERWKSRQDLDDHFAKPYVLELGKLAGELLAEPPRIVFADPEPTGDPVKGRL